MIKALILAAGRGSRMKEHTRTRPKCLTELGGKSLLEWQARALRAAGITDIGVVCGYRAEDIYALQDSLGFTSLLNDRWDKSNMVATLLCAVPWAQGEQCVVSYSDIVYPAEHVQALMRNQKPLSITYDTLWEDLWTMRFANPLDDAETFRQKDGLLVEIGGKADSIAEVQGQYMGLLNFSPKGWQAIARHCGALESAAVDALDMTALLRRLLQENMEIGAVPVQGRWCEVDNEDDLLKYTQKLHSANWEHDWRRI